MWLSHQYKKQAESEGLESETIKASIEQIEAIRNSKFSIPPILTLRHLAKRCNVSVFCLRKITSRQDVEAYRKFSIRKRSGGRRFIAVPSPDLMKVQRWINHFILKKIPIHHGSHAFRKGGSIFKCASLHCEAKWLIKVDIEDFFSSISEIQVYRFFRSLGYQPLISFELARLCTIESHPHSPRKYFDQWIVRKRNSKIPEYGQKLLGHLPQGTPTSPLISNLVNYDLDEGFAKLAADNGLVYTRYSDDICFSSKNRKFGRNRCEKILSEIYKALNAAGYRPNYRKTKIVPPGSRKLILGLNVDGECPKLQKHFKDNVRQHLYYLSKFGPTEHVFKRNFDSIWGMKSHLRGLIDYANMVEPDLAENWLNKFNDIDWPV